MRHSSLAALLSLLLAAALPLLPRPASADPLPVLRRGELLRTEKVRTETTASFRWRLAPSPDSYPRLLFEAVDLVTLYQAHVYQAIEEVPRGGGEPDAPRFEAKPIPGQTIRGEEFSRQAVETAGPMANTTFMVNGVPMETDDGGVAIDSTQSLLALFEDLATTSVPVHAKHEEAGTMSLRMTRHVLKRYDPGVGTPDNLGETDILASLGLDFEPKRSSEREGVAMEVVLPGPVSPGQAFEVSLAVTNRGPSETSSFLGRTVSGKPWLHGRLFYIGSVPPGERRIFVRRFAVPADARTGLVYGGITYWDLLGTIKGKGTVLKLIVESPAQAPAEPAPPAAP